MSRYLPVAPHLLRRRAFLVRLFTGLGAAALGTGVLLAPSGPAHAGIAGLEAATQEMVIGQADAPLTIIEYASLGCPHCADFHHETYPQLKKDYIDTGKVKLVFRDFPLGEPALAATMIARCAGPGRYFGFVDMFFRAQAQWSRADNPLEALIKVARFGGMPPTDVRACLQNQKLLDHIQTQKTKAFEHDGVNATPYFVIGTEKQSGGLSYADFQKIVERELKKTQ